MYKLHEAAVHHLLAEEVISQKSNLVSVQQRHRLGIQLAAHSIEIGIDETLQESVHALFGSLCQIFVFYNYFVHYKMRITKKTQQRNNFFVLFQNFSLILHTLFNKPKQKKCLANR